MIPLSHALAAGGALFVVGLIGLVVRRNLLLIFLSVELLLASVTLHLVAFGRTGGPLTPAQGDAVAVFVLLLAAAEVAVGLALFVAFFRRTGTTDAEAATRLLG